MRILGIDPGMALMGYGIVEQKGSSLVPITYGVIRTGAQQSPGARLVKLYSELTELLDQYQPTAFAIEELFFNKNVSSAISVGQARGVALLAAAERELEIYEFTPLQVKASVTGEGKAQKEQVAFMVLRLLGLRETPKPDDVTDALAIAICGLHGSTRAKWMEAAGK